MLSLKQMCGIFLDKVPSLLDFGTENLKTWFKKTWHTSFDTCGILHPQFFPFITAPGGLAITSKSPTWRVWRLSGRWPDGGRRNTVARWTQRRVAPAYVSHTWPDHTTSTRSLMQAFVTSPLGYCHSLLYKRDATFTNKLQAIRYNAVPFILH